ncbi:MAG: hypothetical protein HRS50_02065 [Mycoplasmataceae bacterium]|nr:hypothetical protein [Mycoplasmataceae bacterium]
MVCHFFFIKKLVPDIIIIPSDFSFYQKKANEVFKIIMSFSNIIEFASIDECYVDVTKLTIKYKPINIAIMISNQIKKETGLSVSVGISTNILLSKIASSLNKPNGITTLYKHEISNKLWPLPINKMYMIGKSSSTKFINNGINTIGDLAKLNINSQKYSILKKMIGINLDKQIFLQMAMEERILIEKINYLNL